MRAQVKALRTYVQDTFARNGYGGQRRAMMRARTYLARDGAERVERYGKPDPVQTRARDLRKVLFRLQRGQPQPRRSGARTMKVL